MKKLIAGFMAALVLLTAVAQPALAASSTPTQTYGFSCDGDVCRLRLDLGAVPDDLVPQGIWFEVARSALRELPGGTSIMIDDAVTITMPGGRLNLLDAELLAEVDDAGTITSLHGSALVPLPTFGLLGDVMLVTPARVELGYQLGEQLSAYEEAPLDPARRYFYFNTDAGLRVLNAQVPGVELSSLPGQRITVIADPAQPLLWFDGEMTVRTDGQLAFLRELIDPADAAGWLPDVLPLRQTATFAVQGQVGRDIEPRLMVETGTQVDAGIAGRWLKLDAVPLEAHGQAVLSPDGLLVSGTAGSELAPATIFGADATAQVFVPFTPETEMTAEFSGDMQVPLAGIDQAGSARVAGDPQQMAAASQGTWQRMQQGAAQAGAVTVAGFDWMARQSQAGYRYMTEQTDQGWAFAQSQWCGLTGACADEAAVSEGVATAMAE